MPRDPAFIVKSDKKNRVLILGAGVMQGPALKIAREMGLETVAADADPSAPCVNLADIFEKVDLKDRDGIEKLAQNHAKDGLLGGIMTAGTDFSANVAWAAGKLGLSGISYDTALDASDKERMRSRFKKEGVPSPEFIIMNEVPADDVKLPFPWPVVVKPVDNMGSRGCRRVDSVSELKPAVKDALHYSRSGRAIIEEYMEGPEFSVDALVYKGEVTICGFADRHIYFPPYFIEMGHTMPSNQADDVIESMLETFKAGIKALGIDNGAAKGDIKLTAKGPMIGEIAARLSGGYMSGWTYPYASGVLPTRGALEIALGQKPCNLKPEWDWVCAERAFISIPGIVKSIHGIEKAEKMPWVKNVFLRIQPGSSVNFPENNVTKCGNIITAAADRAEAVDSAESAARSILIHLEANNSATDTFLAEFGSRFPPDAFAGGEGSGWDSALNSLPETTIPDNYSGIYILPFPVFTESGLKDYVGRSIDECLKAARTLTGLELPFIKNDEKPGNAVILGKSFWKAFIRGGYQAAVYYIDSLQGRND